MFGGLADVNPNNTWTYGGTTRTAHGYGGGVVSIGRTYLQCNRLQRAKVPV